MNLHAEHIITNNCLRTNNNKGNIKYCKNTLKTTGTCNVYYLLLYALK